VIQAAAASGGGNGITTVIFLLLIFGVVYFLMIRPQTKRRREAMQMQNSIGVGDRIVTIGGLHATIVEIEGDVASVEIAPGVVVQFARAAIARRAPESDADAAVVEEPATDEVAVDQPVGETATEPVVAPTTEPAVPADPTADPVVKPAVEEPVDSPVADARKKD
jgi:preprotein translocase subunit YajC